MDAVHAVLVSRIFLYTKHWRPQTSILICQIHSRKSAGNGGCMSVLLLVNIFSEGLTVSRSQVPNSLPTAVVCRF
jgi:hypothetical protein